MVPFGIFKHFFMLFFIFFLGFLFFSTKHRQTKSCSRITETFIPTQRHLTVGFGALLMSWWPTTTQKHAVSLIKQTSFPQTKSIHSFCLYQVYFHRSEIFTCITARMWAILILIPFPLKYSRSNTQLRNTIPLVFELANLLNT